MDEYPLQNYRSEPSPMNLTQTQLSQMRPDAHQQIHNLTYGQDLRENVGASRDTHKKKEPEDETEEEEEEEEDDTGKETGSEQDEKVCNDEEKENFKGKIFELAETSLFWNVKLLCSDGILYQNKLTVGLVFSCLKSADIFTLQAEPELIMSEFTKAEVQFLIQEEFKKMYLLQKEKEEKAAKEEKEKEEEEEEDLEDLEDLEELEELEDLDYEERPRIRERKKRGRPKGSSNRKKIKMEPDNWKGDLDDFPDYDDSNDLDCDLKVKDEEQTGTTRSQNFKFPINFDIKLANEKFNKLLDEVRQNSEKLSSTRDKKDRWKCSLCGLVCSNLAVHIGRNHAEQDFSCSQCDVRVGSEYLLKLHEKTHMYEAKPCRICGKNVKDMKNHMIQLHQGESKNKIQCSQCPKVYVKNAEFQRHFNSAHLGIKGQCPICHKELLPNKITSHIKMVHEKVKNHFCSSCGKGFYDKRDMELHIQRIHLGTKELCIECGKELSAGQLKNHIKKCHSGENLKVICPVCGKKVGYLDEHMRSVHKKEKNHQCPLCPLKCYKRNTLKRHLEWHEKGKLTVNGTPKKPRILKRDKKDSPPEREEQQPQISGIHSGQIVMSEPPLGFPPAPPSFTDHASIMNLANFYRGHSM